MSSIVCQGLQSCLEPRLIEPLVLRHKLAPPKSNLSHSSPWPQRPSQTRQQQQELHQKNPHNEEENNTKDSNNNGGLGGWSFIQALTKTPHNCTEVPENEKAYVHPLLERSSSSLSKKSLEMCTESLGSETGCGISDEFSPLSLKSENSHPIQRSKSREFAKKLTGGGSFPPPLTSISGSDSVRVRPHREGGRLVIKAITVASCNNYFQAERVDGRLRLCLLKDNTSLNSGNEVADEGKEKVDGGEVAGGVVEKHASAGETKAAGESYDDDDDHCGEDDANDDDDDDDKWVESIGGNSGNVGCETEIGEFPRPSRCKEGWWVWEQRDAKLVPIS